jgi:CRP-like cAMP-binding protein
MSPRDGVDLSQLSRCGLFAGVSKKGLGQIAELGKIATFAEGDEVTVQAARGTRFHLVLEGHGDVLVDGRVRSTVGPGETIGEMSLIDSEPVSATIRATSPMRTFSIPSWNFRTLLRNEPSITEQILREVVRRLRAAEAGAGGAAAN